MKAIDKVLTKNRKAPLLIGSVKSNMGHSHGAANLCSVAKVLLAMENRAIPPNLYFSNPSPNISALTENRVKVNINTYNLKYTYLSNINQFFLFYNKEI